MPNKTIFQKLKYLDETKKPILLKLENPRE